MSDLIAGLNNSQNWSLAFQESKEAEQITLEGGYKPLPAFEVPILLDARIVVVKTFSTIPPGKKWRFAGNLRVSQQLPLGVGGRWVELASFPLYLNRTKLVVLPAYANQYQLTLSDAYWLTNLQLTIYQFVGTISSVQIEGINPDLERIERKIDQLL
ncbi:MAG TPA: hypothetical protein VK203_28270 [Nostocaceae cyanobacterium]|nr:hypothetical protein [Nostocaceae cyanobacterium]